MTSMAARPRSVWRFCDINVKRLLGVGRLGIEPRTYGLKVRCSAN
jgi:hypothetical protein